LTSWCLGLSQRGNVGIGSLCGNLGLLNLCPCHPSAGYCG
jgi:hypothetical protein